MKKRKLLLLLPLFVPLISGCSFKEVKHKIGESEIGQKYLHPIYDPIRDAIKGK